MLGKFSYLNMSISLVDKTGEMLKSFTIILMIISVFALSIAKAGFDPVDVGIITCSLVIVGALLFIVFIINNEEREIEDDDGDVHSIR